MKPRKMESQDVLMNERQERKSKKHSKTVEKYHKVNPRIMRLRELNKQLRVQPFKGLKDILQKKDYSGEFKYLTFSEGVHMQMDLEEEQSIGGTIQSKKQRAQTITL